MNKKGEMGIGSIIIVFVAIIIGVTLFLSVAQMVGDKTNVVGVVNDTVTMPASGSAINLDGQAVTDTILVSNATSGLAFTSDNYTVSSNQVINGVLTATLTNNDPALEGVSANVSYTHEPEGYVGGTSRSIALIIPIMFALAVAVIALSPSIRDGLKELS